MQSLKGKSGCRCNHAPLPPLPLLPPLLPLLDTKTRPSNKSRLRFMVLSANAPNRRRRRRRRSATDARRHSCCRRVSEIVTSQCNKETRQKDEGEMSSLFKCVLPTHARTHTHYRRSLARSPLSQDRQNAKRWRRPNCRRRKLRPDSRVPVASSHTQRPGRGSGSPTFTTREQNQKKSQPEQQTPVLFFDIRETRGTRGPIASADKRASEQERLVRCVAQSIAFQVSDWQDGSQSVLPIQPASYCCTVRYLSRIA